ncbi:gastric mucin [Fusarium beomiforme]|uniref:Gastric mucin n=1 Tax=Fusarium beomiforme TaxID=44412 RepID=A0A9P5DXE5_9HYPO|nr:gastric mucin [Fusarium beomiforme]
MSIDNKLLGSIVAFEGHVDTISTQLRLLPTSPQILILPNIQNYISNKDSANRSDVRVYVKKIHEATVARYEAAQSFLHGSTPSGRRLVFMNGGTPCARTLCIKTIMDYETDGDYCRAESLFNQLVKDGVAGLDNPVRDWRRQDLYQQKDKETQEEEPEDPITRAMRAADALDRQTASLQPSNELDLTLTPRPRSNSLPLYGYEDNFGDDAPFFVFGASKDEDGTEADETMGCSYSPQASRFSARHYDRSAGRIYRDLSNLQSPSPRASFLTSPSCVGEVYGLMAAPVSHAPEGLSPRSDVLSIPSTDNVVYGEASLVDMRTPGRSPTLARIKSLDRIYPASPKYRDLCVSAVASGLARQSENEPEQESSKAHRHSQTITTSTHEFISNRLSYIEGSRTVIVRTNLPIIKVASVPLEKKRKPARASYVDRGTDAEDISQPKETFQPVLPFLEDLVVHFREEVPEPLLNSVTRGLRTGHLPIAICSPTSEIDDGNALVPGTPESNSIRDVSYAESHNEELSVAEQSSYSDEYDPFAYNQSPWLKKPITNVPKLKIARPPTPAKTPPPLVSDVDSKFHDLQINGQETAITVQNALRSLLQEHFPPETQGYRQFQFSLLPELEGLWKPVLWETEPNSNRGSCHRIDQILAIGAQRGVKRDYASAITGQLEKLGTKCNGMSRSGRLDFRYLLANAMQAYTAQPLASQAKDNPFANSFLLATLIIPHLETYLALHAEVRYLLLEYPPEHLATVLALQKLVGVDLMKVAQIVDASSKSIPFTHLRGNSITSPEQGPIGRFGKTFPQSPGSGYDVTVSKANFLITSTATDAEIATFIATISRILSKTSDFYVPHEPPKKPSPKKSKPPSMTGTFSPFPRVPSATHSPPMSPTLGASLGAALSGSSAVPSRAPSIAETVKTAKSSRSKTSRSYSKPNPSAADARSILTMYVDDSDWDQEDRRIMPLLEDKAERRKGNSHKALKFLGLS